MKFNEFDIHAFGHTITAAGIIYTDGEYDYSFYFPEEKRNISRLPREVEMTLEEWEALLKQTDEVSVLAARSSLFKAFIKKSQRQIDTNISWKVYSRDNYSCRYCGRTGIPLTVDHIDLWEDGGVSTEANLNTSCKPCNRNRGNMSYVDWLKCDKYTRVSSGLSTELKQANLDLVATLPELKKLRVNYQRGKR